MHPAIKTLEEKEKEKKIRQKIKELQEDNTPEFDY